jgi:hypothetical protein
MRISDASSPSNKRKPAAKETVVTYRGVEIQHTYLPTRFTHEELERAVEAAIARNAHRFPPDTET